MNYEELSFALKVRKIARQRMITEIGDKAEEEDKKSKKKRTDEGKKGEEESKKSKKKRVKGEA